MTKHIKYRSRKKQTLTSKTNYKTLRIHADKYSRLVAGPAEFVATVNVTFANLKPGASAWIRIVRAGYKKGQPLKVGRTLAFEEIQGTTGGTYASLAASGAVNKDYGGGRQTRVYALVTTNNPEPLNITDVRVEGLRN